MIQPGEDGSGVPTPHPGGTSGVDRLMELADGYLATQLLYVAADLGVADLLVRRPMSTEAIAGAVGAVPATLRRVLRGLAAIRVLGELPNDEFALAPDGEALRTDHPQSVRGAILARGSLYYPAIGSLLDAVRGGAVPFEHVHQLSFFEYLERHPVQASSFQSSMTARSRLEADAVVAAYPFADHQHIVDIGGGHGILLARILMAAPRSRGTLFDRPDTATAAAEQLSAILPAGSFEVMGGDFFAEVPAGADVYLLSRVLHDWDDAAALRILSTCRQAMPIGSTLLIVEALLPDVASDNPAAIRMDLHMLALFDGGRERTAAEFESILTAAAFVIDRVIELAIPSGISIVVARPA